MPARIKLQRLLIANRGEIAIRIAATAAELRMHSVAVYSEDDSDSLHCKRADEAWRLQGTGPRAYLDIEQIIEAARQTQCDAIHPGYGFLSENAALATRCEEAGIVFVGPTAEQLSIFGDKLRARHLAAHLGIAVARGTDGVATPQSAMALLESLDAGGMIVIKAVAGGGGRGIRVVGQASEVEQALERCRSEAASAFGSDEVYVEEFLPRARHVEIQVLGDGRGGVVCLGDRECSIQRQRQKLIEVAPAPHLPKALRGKLMEAAAAMAQASSFRSLGTFEFLIRSGQAGDFVFLEANPRIQVEHTVTEETLGIDLVRLQLQLAAGASLADMGLEAGRTPLPRGQAIELRVNLEDLQSDGTVRPAGGMLTSFEPPCGPGIRVDTTGHAGFVPNPRFDSLLAKLVVFSGSGDFGDLAAKAQRALQAFAIEGCITNKTLLLNILAEPEFQAGNMHTQFVQEHLARLLQVCDAGVDAPASAQADARSPMPQDDVPPHFLAVTAPMSGTVIQLGSALGQEVFEGEAIFILEAMKMETAICAPTSGVLRQVRPTVGDFVSQGQALAYIEPGTVAARDVTTMAHAAKGIRSDLQELLDRRALTQDAARPQVVAARQSKGQRTARQNVHDLCDADSFVEYGQLVVAAQRARRPLDDLIRNTPADGQICGVGTVNGSQCVVLAYDYSVLGGSQGHNNHHKTDRMLEIAHKERLPVILFGEGGGGRSGDTEGSFVHQKTFNLFPKLSGVVPLIAVVSGYCFAGNAALVGMCDVVIATRNSNIGMGGPGMIEGGGLGRVRADEIGPAQSQAASGVIDILVDDEQAAVVAAKKFFSYRQGTITQWECADQNELRDVIPQDRRRTYQVRRLIELLADKDSVLELREGFGLGMVTSLARIQGHPVGIIANNPLHLAGAIDRDAADKAARFMQLCDSYGIAMVSLCDTPGIMVGADAERTGLVRHSARMLLAGANLRVPYGIVVTRRAYGLGKVGMTAGSFKATAFAVSWPTGEFGAMNFDGAVKLAYGKELDAIADPAQRERRRKELIDELHECGKGLSRAMEMECDDVIDPAQTRHWIMRMLKSHQESQKHSPHPSARSFIDSW